MKNKHSFTFPSLEGGHDSNAIANNTLEDEDTSSCAQWYLIRKSLLGTAATRGCVVVLVVCGAVITKVSLNSQLWQYELATTAATAKTSSFRLARSFAAKNHERRRLPRSTDDGGGGGGGGKNQISIRLVTSIASARSSAAAAAATAAT